LAADNWKTVNPLAGENMQKMTIPIAVFMVMMLASCSHDKQTVPATPSSPVPGVKVVKTEDYEPFRILMLGDSYCGTISSNLQIRFDCGPLAGAYTADRNRDGRCVVSRSPDRVTATIFEPPDGQESEYYPINVFSPNKKVEMKEVRRLAFEIEKAVLKK
jgi:hypothetical protein